MRNWHIVDGTKLCRHQTMLSLLLLHHSELVVLLLDLVYSVGILLAKELMLVTLDSLG